MPDAMPSAAETEVKEEAEVKPAEGVSSAGSTGRTFGVVINNLSGGIKRQIALRRYAPGLTRAQAHLTLAQAHLHLAAGEMDDIRNRAELFYATSEEAWQEGAEGRAYAAVLAELRLTACALREMMLPDVGRLR